MEKLELFKKVLEDLKRHKSFNGTRGLCNAFSDCGCVSVEDYPEIMQYKPKVIDKDGFWFNPLDHDRRIEIMKTEIAKLEQIPKRVRIIRSSRNYYWYINKIGQEYDIKRETPSDYITTTGGGILKCDCEPVEQETKLPKRIRVIKTNKQSYWYSEFIGHEFDVVKERDCGCYYVKYQGQTDKYGVDKDDCEPVDKEPVNLKQQLIDLVKSGKDVNEFVKKEFANEFEEEIDYSKQDNNNKNWLYRKVFGKSSFCLSSTNKRGVWCSPPDGYELYLEETNEHTNNMYLKVRKIT